MVYCRRAIFLLFAGYLYLATSVMMSLNHTYGED